MAQLKVGQDSHESSCQGRRGWCGGPQSWGWAGCDSTDVSAWFQSSQDQARPGGRYHCLHLRNMEKQNYAKLT